MFFGVRPYCISRRRRTLPADWHFQSLTPSLNGLDTVKIIERTKGFDCLDLYKKYVTKTGICDERDNLGDAMESNKVCYTGTKTGDKSESQTYLNHTLLPR